MPTRISFPIVIVLTANFNAAAAELKLAESLPSGTRTSLEIKVSLDGDVTLPAKAGGKPERLAVGGQSKLVYDERALPNEDAETEKLLRIYRSIEIDRVVGSRRQSADIRKEVRRLVVLRNAGVKSPFSPDGPLSWNEIDVVKNDLFAPALAAGLLPNKIVKDGDKWTATAAAVRELTDLEKIDSGDLQLTFVGVVKFDGKDRARLSVAGTVKGIDANGPARHTLDGTAYFDLESSMLTYLSVKGTHELLDAEGKTAGRIDGRFTMTRSLSTTESLSDAAIAKLSLKPTAENTRLLYDNTDLGIRFVHPRRWRVGAVQGKQITLDGPNGAGILITLETDKTLPTAEAFQKETLDFMAKGKGTATNASKIERVRDKPAIDRFGFDADLVKQNLRMEYAIVAGTSGGATIAARLPLADAKELVDDVGVLLKEIAVGK